MGASRRAEPKGPCPGRRHGRCAGRDSGDRHVTCIMQVFYGNACGRQVKCQAMKRGKKTRPVRRSDCAVACTLDIIGDRWTLLVVRDLLRGRRYFDDFLRSPEGIATNVLSARLARCASRAWSKRRQTRPISGGTLTGSATTVCASANCSATSPPGASSIFRAPRSWAESSRRRDNHADSPARASQPPAAYHRHDSPTGELGTIPCRGAPSSPAANEPTRVTPGRSSADRRALRSLSDTRCWVGSSALCTLVTLGS